MNRQTEMPPVGENPAMKVADSLAGFVVEQLEKLVRAHLPEWRVPGVFAGCQVRADVRADLAYTLGYLYEYGVDLIGGIPLRDAIAGILRPINGPETHTFFSYRVAETLAHFGAFDRNELVADWSAGERDNLAMACDSTESIAQLESGRTPLNYTAVLARCEIARARLGLISDDDERLAGLLRRTAELLAHGYVDDSPSGDGIYDIYTADVYLFSEPFACRLGDVWTRGVRAVLWLAEHTVTATGVAFPWGRSSGTLADCMTIELGALAIRDGLGTNSQRWLSFVQSAFDKMATWFTNDGLVSAHQYRSTDSYRGLHRRLQMTLDCLGKLAWSAIAMRTASRSMTAEPLGYKAAFPDQDAFLWFHEGKRAGIWCYRNPNIAFVLPLVGTTLNDYLPAPHNPGLFEVPVEIELPTGVPVAHVNGARFVPGHLPSDVLKMHDGLSVRYDSFIETRCYRGFDTATRLNGRRTVTYRVDGRTLHVNEDIQFHNRPQAIGLQVTERPDRPLTVTFSCATGHNATVVDTAGVREYRSFWAELTRVHEIDLDPSEHLQFSYSITPVLRVLSSDPQARYHRAIYDALTARVIDKVPVSTISEWQQARELEPSRATQRLVKILRKWDVFHLHWPESGTIGFDIAHHRLLIEALAEAGVPVVWTQHNLTPHSKDDRFFAIYEAWAAAARGVIHHSHWGMKQAQGRYRFREGVIHRVVPHPYLCPPVQRAGRAQDRRLVEGKLGLTPGRLRLGIIGAPRKEKHIGIVVDALIECERDDLELLILSCGPDDQISPHPRIVALPYEPVPSDEFVRRVAAIDILVLPFESEGMLTTGTFSDAVAHGIPTLISDWPFLAEVLGDAGIRYGASKDDLVACLRALDATTLDRAAAAARRLQPIYDPSRIADLTLDVLEAVATARP